LGLDDSGENVCMHAIMQTRIDFLNHSCVDPWTICSVFLSGVGGLIEKMKIIKETGKHMGSCHLNFYTNGVFLGDRLCALVAHESRSELKKIQKH